MVEGAGAGAGVGGGVGVVELATNRIEGRQVAKVREAQES